MDPDDIVSSFTSLKIPKTHATVGLSNLFACNKQYKSLFVNRQLPDTGWSDVQIQTLIFLLSTLDTNNNALVNEENGSSRWCGVGEREGRVYSSLVAHRHFGLSHGMGRIGDITEPQPKAVGSSVMVKLTLLLALDALRRGSQLDGRGVASHGILLPLCTGMSMSLVLSSLRQEASKERTVVLWSRIDQKSCFKAISIGGTAVCCCPYQDFDRSGCDRYGSNGGCHEAKREACLGHYYYIIVLCTSVPDLVDKVAKLCEEHGVAHVINNAYGLQCEKTSKLINRANAVGRVDAVVCSTDKNFLVPVGGAIVISPNEKVIQNVGKVYAGRASSSPVLDLFITLLSMGLSGYRRLLAERQELLDDLSTRFESIAEKHGERLLQCPSNTISFGITLDNLARRMEDDESEDHYLNSVSSDISYFGSMLFNRCVSGTRVVPRGQTKSMGGSTFVGFGSSTVAYPHAYMTAACAIGVSKGEVDEFFIQLDKTLKEFKSKQAKSKKQAK